MKSEKVKSVIRIRSPERKENINLKNKEEEKSNKNNLNNPNNFSSKTGNNKIEETTSLKNLTIFPFPYIEDNNENCTKLITTSKPLSEKFIKLNFKDSNDLKQNEAFLAKQYNANIYEFDSIYKNKISIDSIYIEVIKDKLNNLLKGKNISITLLGQSNSGKTYLLKGNKSIGLLQRTIQDLFNLIEINSIMNTNEKSKIKLKLSIIYTSNNLIYDLIKEKYINSENEQIEIKNKNEFDFFLDNSFINLEKHKKTDPNLNPNILISFSLFSNDDNFISQINFNKISSIQLSFNKIKNLLNNNKNIFDYIFIGCIFLDNNTPNDSIKTIQVLFIIYFR